MRRLAVAATLIALASMPLAAAARPSIYSQVLAVYQSHGSIPPCRFTSPQLAAALKGVDTYGEQYFADFTDAIQSALDARASGACAPGARVAAVSTSASAGPPLRPGPLAAPTDADLPAPILLMAALGLVIASVLGIGAIARAFGWDPPWAARWRHAVAEASYRISGGWANVADWWRSGP